MMRDIPYFADDTSDIWKLGVWRSSVGEARMGCCVYTEINAANKFLARRVAALCKRVSRICRLSWGPEKYTFRLSNKS